MNLLFLLSTRCLVIAELIFIWLTPCLWAVAKGPYLGGKLPGMAPEPFLPEFFNIYMYLHGRIVFSPDGRELFWVLTTAQLEKRFYFRQDESGFWKGPTDAFLSLANFEKDPCFSPDGSRVFYQSRAALKKRGSTRTSTFGAASEAQPAGAIRSNLALRSTPLKTTRRRPGSERTTCWYSAAQTILFLPGPPGAATSFYHS